MAFAGNCGLNLTLAQHHLTEAEGEGTVIPQFVMNYSPSRADFVMHVVRVLFAEELGFVLEVKAELANDVLSFLRERR